MINKKNCEKIHTYIYFVIMFYIILQTGLAKYLLINKATTTIYYMFIKIMKVRKKLKLPMRKA